MPVYFKVVTPDGRSTRDPLPEEIPLIKAFMQPFIAEHGDGPIGVWEVPGVGEVDFTQMSGNGKGQ